MELRILLTEYDTEIRVLRSQYRLHLQRTNAILRVRQHKAMTKKEVDMYDDVLARIEELIGLRNRVLQRQARVVEGKRMRTQQRERVRAVLAEIKT